ncbi:helix-turn-helix domain-containing protein [Corynebacterium lizhenjunii]|uniref:helix-turn-helix domain-containing protein n=1 Tax=Corynebacterium lizhenjunii TaxID=2709394 RepID=UPI0013EA8CA7|nr:helix-turn-helix transcriptional regulator [Corynebacterium lizhenjunii]
MAGAVPTWTLSDRVRKARDFSGLKQAELSERVGMARTSLARIEQGKTKPRRTTLIAIAFATGVSLEWLENGETPGGGEPTGGEVVRHQGLEPRTH